MRLGIFDSGLGGIMIAKAIHDYFPDIDKVYLGDTLNLPYGSRSEDAIYQASLNCIHALFERDCQLIIMACNTASARALRRLQQEYLPAHYPDRRILGVVVPTIEEARERGYQKLAVIGTDYTIDKGIYCDELSKIDPRIRIIEKATPLLVPLIENCGEKYLDTVLRDYLKFTTEEELDALLLGCTHYIHLKDRLRADYDFDVISQDEIIPQKLEAYFDKHESIYDALGQNGCFDFYVTDLTEHYMNNARSLFGSNIKLTLLEGIHD